MTKQEMLELRLDGLPYELIAQRAGISRQRVHQLLSPPKHIRDFLITKNKGVCQICGIYVGKNGHVHHPFDEEHYEDIDNLMFLCSSCHRRQHIGLEHFRQYMKRHPNATLEEAKAALNNPELERYQNKKVVVQQHQEEK